MTVESFVSTLISAATTHNTLYVMGCIGAPINQSTAKRYIKAHSYNQKAEREKMINDAIDTGCFGFDCVCLIKSILWGWKADPTHQYGGAVYKSNGVDDITLDKMLELCSNVSDDFSQIEKGEYLWTNGHCGIYIGNGLAVECTPKWKNGVQITAVKNIATPEEYPARAWKKHGKLPYIEYPKTDTSEDNLDILFPIPTDKDEKIPDESKPTAIKMLLGEIIKLLIKIYSLL